jgi:urea carboxylase-associated protein 2
MAPADHDTSTPLKARDHARSMAGTVVDHMPTLPASATTDLPPGATPADMLREETLGPGGYTSLLLPPGARCRLINLHGDACVTLMLHNADQPAERLNIADTVKVQWNAYLGPGKLLLSDMGRPLASILHDTCGQHDTFTGPSTAWSNAARYGSGDNHSPHPSARDRLLLALTKHGLTRTDLPPTLNLFKRVNIAPDGSLHLLQNSSAPGQFVTLRAEMPLLLTLANTPHRLDPRPVYTATALRLTAWRGPGTPADDPIRLSSPEATRAFENLDEYLAAHSPAL